MMSFISRGRWCEDDVDVVCDVLVERTLYSRSEDMNRGV